METIEIILAVGGLLTLGISIAAYLRQNKNDAADHATKITTLEERINTIQGVVNQISVAELARMQQTVETLSDRVNKLDNDVENKIDKLSEKIDALSNRINELFIALAKNNKNNNV
jgi:peptidoglycan hydrolase CwlO-like protein